MTGTGIASRSTTTTEIAWARPGMWFSGRLARRPAGRVIELGDHPWFVATQAHPELKSRPNRPHPLFRDFVGAAASHAGLASGAGAVAEEASAHTRRSAAGKRSAAAEPSAVEASASSHES